MLNTHQVTKKALLTSFHQCGARLPKSYQSRLFKNVYMMLICVYERQLAVNSKEVLYISLGLCHPARSHKFSQTSFGALCKLSHRIYNAFVYIHIIHPSAAIHLHLRLLTSLCCQKSERRGEALLTCTHSTRFTAQFIFDTFLLFIRAIDGGTLPPHNRCTVPCCFLICLHATNNSRRIYRAAAAHSHSYLLHTCESYVD